MMQSHISELRRQIEAARRKRRSCKDYMDRLKCAEARLKDIAGKN